MSKMNRVRKKFIIYNIGIIGIITVIIAALVYFGSPSKMPAGRLAGTIAITLGLVFIGSTLSSKIAMKPVQSSWRRQLDFTADASHELRTPLAVIRANLELVMDNPDETVGSQRRWLDNIHMETVRMTSLVDDLLTLSRSDAGEKALDYSYFSLNAVVIECAALFETAAEQKSIDIQVATNDEIEIWADISRIRQLLRILLDNAVKYSDKPGHIQIELFKGSNDMHLIVSDMGKGIAPDHLPNIFNRFYRVDKQTAEGFGLGLSIAEWIVKEHDGSIQADSAVGEGTRITVSFPIKTRL